MATLNPIPTSIGAKTVARFTSEALGLDLLDLQRVDWTRDGSDIHYLVKSLDGAEFKGVRRLDWPTCEACDHRHTAGGQYCTVALVDRPDDTNDDDWCGCEQYQFSI